MTADLVTFGETMALLTSNTIGPIRHATGFRLSIGGAESNTAIGVSRLGHRASWMGRVGADEMGRLVLDRLRGEGVDVSRATVDADAPTGLMLKGRRLGGVTQVAYYRHGSAGSSISPDHLDEDLIGGARLLYVSGVTPALGRGAKAAVTTAMSVARESGVTVALDPNYRSALWATGEATACLVDLCRHADVVLTGKDEALMIAAARDPADAAARIGELGPRQVVVRLESGKAMAIADGTVHTASVPMRAPVDPVGAGDAFNAGYLAALLEDRKLDQRMSLALNVAGTVVATEGDWEGLPNRNERYLHNEDIPDVIR